MHDPEAFVAHFQTIWASPQEHLDTFLDFLSPDILLTAPIVGSSRGRDAGYRAFRSAFHAIPDLRGEVTGWAARGDEVFIAMEFTGTIGGRRVTWPNVDRFRFADGVAVERRAFFDPTLLLGAFLSRPSGWRQLWSLVFERSGD